MGQILSKNLKTLYGQGSFKEISLLPISFKTLNSENKIFYISALVFTGELKKAELLISNDLTNSKPQTLAAFLFYKALLFVRESKYKDSEKVVKNIEKLRNKHRNAHIDFAYFQSLAAIQYYQGQLQKALTNVRLSLNSAYLSENSHYEIMAMDLLGHCLIHNGNISEGLSTFKLALQKSLASQMLSFSEAIKITLLKYKLRFSIGQNQKLKLIEKISQQVKADDHFSKNEIILELIRQHIIMGNYSSAQELINANRLSILGQKSQRQIARFHLTQAYLCLLIGKNDSALKETIEAESCLKKTHDLPLIKSIFGIKYKIYKKLSRKTEILKLNKDLKIHSKKGISYLDLRIQNRENGIPSGILIGEDPLGDLLDTLYSNPSKYFSDLIKHKLLGFIPDLFKIDLQKNHLLIDPESKHLLMASEKGIELSPKKLGSNTLKIIMFLNSKAISKEELIKEVWGYEYHPLRHDTLFHSSLSRIRKLFKYSKDFIKHENGKFFIAPDFKLTWINPLEIDTFKTEIENPRSTISTDTLKAIPSWTRSSLIYKLNSRQITSLRESKPQQFFTVRDYLKKHQVTHMTAFRDLNNLCELGILDRSGRGRSTFYFLKEDIKL